MEPIIKSLLDNDLYKFSMMNCVIKLFPTAKVRYTFILRSKVDFPEGFAEELRRQIWYMKDLGFRSTEKRFFLEKCKYIDPSYFDFLDGYCYNPSEVGIIQNGGELQLNIEGLWYRVILWEVPLLALISELYFQFLSKNSPDYKIKSETERKENNQKKAALFNYSEVKVSDFGTRRRYSFDIQKEMVEDLSTRMNKGLFVGTSNVYLAYLFNLTPIGTEAHEWFSVHAAKYGYKLANTMALENWVNVYQGDLGTALSDTYTTDIFLKSFNKKYSKLYDGVRQDSGDPYTFIEKMIKHYIKMGVDPISKTIIFSDSLTPEKAIELHKWCNGKINCSFGIGTNLSNDVGVIPLNMVIKVTACKFENDDNWIDAIKLSDDKGKETGDKNELALCKQILHI